MLGTGRPIALTVDGDGSWARWNGVARLDLSGRRTADLRLRAENGRYGLAGRLAPAQFWTGKKARLTAPVVQVSGSATLEDRQLEGRLTLRSPALTLAGTGTIDLARSAFRNLRIGADLHPAAGPVPQHDRAEGAAGRASRRPLQDLRLRLPPDQPAGRLRQYRIRGRLGPGARPLLEGAGGGARGAVGPAGDRGRRRRGRDPRQFAGRRPAQGDRQGADRRRAEPHLGQVEGQAQPVRRPDHRPLRRRPVGRPHPLPHSRARNRRRRHRIEGGPPPRAARARSSPARAGPGSGGSTIAFLAGLAGGLPYLEADLVRGTTTSSSTSATSSSPRRRSGSRATASGGATAPSSSRARAPRRPTARSR